MGEKLDKRKGVKIPQECIDLIVKGITDLKSTAQLARDVAREFDMSVSGARKRVENVWAALAEEAKLDRKVERQKVSHALLRIYREASEDMKLENVLKLLDEHDIDFKARLRILSKWDPYKGASIALKALEQYTKLHGVSAPEQVQVQHSGEITNPLSMTPQERQKRISELLLKGNLKGPQSLTEGSGELSN